MNILIISQRFYPEQFRINDISKELVLQGHKVTVLTGLPNYPTGHIPEEYRRHRNRKQILDGVEVIRTFEVGRRPGVIGLGINYLSLTMSSCLKALFLKNDYDVIYVYQISPVFCILPAWILKKRFGIPSLVYCCDLWPESLKAYDISDEHILFKIIKRVSNKLYRSSDAIAVTSTPFIAYFKDVHGICNNVYYMPQHAEQMYLDMNLDAQNGDIVKLLFCGNIGKVQNIDCIIKAVSLVKCSVPFEVHIVGDGSDLDNCKNIVSQLRLENKVFFHGRRPLDDMPSFYKLADACLLTLTGESFIGMTIPSKLQGYMASGKPVIAAINGAAQEIIKDSGCGLCVRANDIIGMAEIMTEFIEHKELYKECGPNGRAYFKNHFTRDIFMKTLLNMLEKVRENRYV